MKKGFLIWLVVLMLISLSGTLTVLFFWLKNPLQMNYELFARIVNGALIKAVQQYEVNQDVRTIDERINNDSILYEKKPPQKISQSNMTGAIRNIKQAPAASVRDSNKTNKQTGRKELKIEYQDWNIRRPIDASRLRVITDEALKQTGIINSFNYAILSNDSIIQSDLTETSKQHWYKTLLFPDDILSRDIYLGVCFPGTHLYLSHNSFIKVLSIVSTVVIIIVFYISLLYTIKQKKSSAMKTDFINHMTHEFKTPITTIGLAADSILSKEVIGNEAQVGFYSRMIKEENKRMNDMVEKLLQAARLGRKELYFRSQEVNIHNLIDNAIDGISIQIEKRGGTIIKKLEADNPVVSTDPSHFTNVINNLLDNANKYSTEAPEIIVSTRNDMKGIYLTVEDKGIGISKKMLSKIFNKFYRTTSEDIDNIKGFGLGLSYIKAILKLNKGKIKVFSESGKGSRFEVFLPFLSKKV